MQAYIRRDIRRGRDYGLIVVSETDFFTEPIFFSLQRFTDGKFLSANSLWRSGKEELRAGEYHWVNGILSIVVGPDILLELDADTTYRMTINGSASFPLSLSRDVVHLLHKRAAQDYACSSAPAGPDGADEAVGEDSSQVLAAAKTAGSACPALVQKQHRNAQKNTWTTPILCCLTILGGIVLVGWHLTHDSMQLVSEPIPLSDNVNTQNLQDLQAVFVDKSGQPAQTALTAVQNRLKENVQGRSLSTSYFSTESLQKLRTDTDDLSASVLAEPDRASAGYGQAPDAGRPSNLSATPHDTGTTQTAQPDQADQTAYTRTVQAYLAGGAVTPAASVALARQVRLPGASSKDTEQAFLLLQDAAEKGNTEAMFLLAQFYDPLCTLPHGNVTPNPSMAREWYRRAEAGGLLHAYLASNALRSHLKKLAEEGDSEALNALRNW